MKKIIFTFISAISLFGADAQTLIEQNGCMNCHNIMGRKQAPAFMGVARRNLMMYGNDARNQIKNSIKNGSSGKYPMFRDSAMPSFSNLSDEDLDAIVTWIFDEYSQNKQKMQAHKMGGGRGHGKGMGRGMNNMSW